MLNLDWLWEALISRLNGCYLPPSQSKNILHRCKLLVSKYQIISGGKSIEKTYSSKSTITFQKM